MSRTLLTLVAFAGLAAAAHADLIDNSREQDRVGWSENGVSQLNPWRASYRRAGDCAWLMGGLASAGYRSSEAGSRGRVGDGLWDFSFRRLSGDMIVDTYRAWSERAPRVSIDNFSVYSDQNLPMKGGAAFGLRYRSGEGDPTEGLHWIQVIRTNTPLNGSPGEYQIYMDNVPNGEDTPFYDSPGDGVHGSYQDAQRRTNFWMADRPRRTLQDGVDWQAQVFLATWNRDREEMTIYDGVWWGFGLSVPAPGSAAVLFLGGILAARRRR